MIAEEAVCPSANDYDLRKPRIEGLKQLGEAIDIRIVDFVAYRVFIIVPSFIA
jgi:hypothetical protein